MFHVSLLDVFVKVVKIQNAIRASEGVAPRKGPNHRAAVRGPCSLLRLAAPKSARRRSRRFRGGYVLMTNRRAGTASTMIAIIYYCICIQSKQRCDAHAHALLLA